ncbi:hypothetical protein POTOM_031263 [Populus tomentosa]|uniref:Lipoyl-binding domain-containing protein n=1 Tax=Populus tomentosa TaxID=118781 RepID=A0A8X8CRJ9_POPTO|nr:hypothetical protein POTOM_031263 [Populus tomentosa]
MVILLNRKPLLSSPLYTQNSSFLLQWSPLFFFDPFSVTPISPCICNLLAQGQGLTVGRKLISYPSKRNLRLVSCVKTSEAPAIAKSDDGNKQGSLEKNSLRNATFPNGFEALVLEVCDETEIAELKLKVTPDSYCACLSFTECYSCCPAASLEMSLIVKDKVGDFEMHLKRNVGAAKAPLISSTPLPPIPTPPMEVSAAVSPSPSPSKSVEKSTPFTNVSFGKSSKLAALEASGANGYVLVASPTVGSFRRNRTVKGKKQPPICKEGDVIKEGQVIGYLDQFGTELPVKSDVAGEVLKLLFNDGDAVGYGDPLIAVLPSFHGINT